MYKTAGESEELLHLLAGRLDDLGVSLTAHYDSEPWMYWKEEDAGVSNQQQATSLQVNIQREPDASAISATTM